MRIFICGSASGTEPIKGRHHSAWILETENKLYQFDAVFNVLSGSLNKSLIRWLHAKTHSALIKSLT